jgi:hypothetical protein
MATEDSLDPTIKLSRVHEQNTTSRLAASSQHLYWEDQMMKGLHVELRARGGGSIYVKLRSLDQLLQQARGFSGIRQQRFRIQH